MSWCDVIGVLYHNNTGMHQIQMPIRPDLASQDLVWFRIRPHPKMLDPVHPYPKPS